MLLCIREVLGKDEVAQFRARLDQADWQDGAKTAGPVARTRKHNQQLGDDSELAIALGNQILRRLGNHPLFISASLPGKIHPPRFNRYASGGTYGTHVDGALMRIPGTNLTMRSDLSATLFLTEPEDYEGGELEIVEAMGARSFKLPAGDLLLYPSTTLHRVNPVSRGARISSFFWIESAVKDEALRTMLFELDQAIQELAQSVPMDDPRLIRLTGVYHNLVRHGATT